MLMVALVHSNWNLILAELSQWIQLSRAARRRVTLPSNIRTKLLDDYRNLVCSLMLAK